MTSQNKKELGRRQFLARTARAGISIAGAAAAASLLYDQTGPEPALDTNQHVKLPDFSVPHRTGQTISIIKGSDRTKTVAKAIELLGGIQRFIKPGDTVAIKPNIAFASPPTLGATAHPQLVAELVKLCKKAGAKKIIVTDNPINDPASCFTLTGIRKAAAQAGADVIPPKDNLFRTTTLENAKLIRNWPIFFKPFENADKLIGVAPVKHHHRSGASMTMKNWYGLLGGRRNIFHQDINTIIAELSGMVKPTLVILDATVTMITNGPTGGSLSDLKPTNTLIASCDQVAADAYGATLLGLKTADLPYLAKARNLGSGTADYQSLKPVIAQIT